MGQNPRKFPRGAAFVVWLAFGAVIGYMFDNLVMGIAIGVFFGIAMEW